MDTSAFLSHLKALPSYEGQIVHVENISPRAPRYGQLEKPLSPGLVERLKAKGVRSLYTHQTAAINALGKGNNVMVSTPSASGKTMCYNLPVLEAISAQKFSRALYLFPTKALAQDQLRTLRELASPDILEPADCATYDGDTTTSERAEIRRKARIVLTNPDMLHMGILPNHRAWARWLRRLKYVVVDEAHVYRGVFGSHVTHVLRRLRRLCSFYGASPQFICCSATIANPKEHAENLVGLPFEVVDNDGAPYGGKDFVFWQPPFIDKVKATRRSASSEATSLFTELVRHEIRSLVFTRTRKLAELIYIYSRDELEKTHRALASRIKPYRAGYLPGTRRQIEQELFGGQLLGAVSTTALELGVDIGDLDATVLTGYPGSIASTWQQAGRSGRRGERALSFLIGRDDPLDQYLMRRPEAFFQKTVEHALINPGNQHILKPHLLCAAWELPLNDGDEQLFGEGFAQAAVELERQGWLKRRQQRLPAEPKRWYLSPDIAYPAQKVNIRSTSEKNYMVIDTEEGALLETVESAVAFFQVHTGAIYLHQGESYLITDLDLKSGTAYARPADVTYYTQTKDITDISIVKQTGGKTVGGSNVCCGEVEVTTQVLGFKKKRQFTEEVIGEEPLDLPPQQFSTVALWFDIPQGVEEAINLAGLDWAGGLHALEHAAISILPLFALCDRNDIGGVSTPAHRDTGKAQVFIYDAYPGGVGIAEKGFELIDQLWEATCRVILECPCEAGCPSCIQSPKCGNNNEPLDKKAARLILDRLLGR